MGESREREGFFGKYTEHFDDSGNKIGESREQEGFFGDYTEHTNTSGEKIGESREREGFFGDYTEHTNTSGEKIGESREREGFFGDYTEHTGPIPLVHRSSKSTSGGTSSTPPSSPSSSTNYTSTAYSDNYTSTTYSDATVRTPTARDTTLSRIISFGIFVVIFIAVAVGYTQYSREQARIQNSRTQYNDFMQSAKANFLLSDFENAERYYSLAWQIAEELGEEYKNRLLRERSKSYRKVIVSKGNPGFYKVQGSIFMRFENPLICIKSPEKCGYHFRPTDQGRIFSSHNNITIEISPGRILPLRSGMKVSDFFLLGHDICCSKSRESVIPKLTFRTSSGTAGNVYIVRRQ